MGLWHLWQQKSKNSCDARVRVRVREGDCRYFHISKNSFFDEWFIEPFFRIRTFVEKNSSLFIKRPIIFGKTTCHFSQNDLLLFTKRPVAFQKWAVTFHKTTCRLKQNDRSIDEYELSSFAEFPKGNCRGGCNIERIHLVRHRNAHHKVSFGNSLWRKSVTFGAHNEG